MGGWIVTINSILNSLPLYYFSFLKAPKKVINSLIAIQHDFYGTGGLRIKRLTGFLGIESIQQNHKVDWDKTCRTIQYLLVNEMAVENTQGALWQILLSFRFGNIHDCIEHDSQITSSSLWWKYVVGINSHSMCLTSWFFNHIIRG